MIFLSILIVIQKISLILKFVIESYYNGIFYDIDRFGWPKLTDRTW